MKKITLALILLCGAADAQINLENTYPNGPINTGKLGVIHLSSSGYKYMESDSDQVRIYNLNHSIFKTINIPQQVNVYYQTWQVTYVSEELFNTNPADVEYVITYGDWIGNAYHVRIYDENSNLVFSKDSFLLINALGDGFQKGGITYTSGGVKMILVHQSYAYSQVYALPGVLPCNECASGIMTGIAQAESNNGVVQQLLPDPYPNPTNNTTTISYEIPDGIRTGEIIIYNMIGQEVKRFAVSNTFTSLVISANDLADGTYHYNLVTVKGIIPGNEFIVMK